ncbi:MAG: hypothetical protein H5T72_02470 [Actinobacteria bacterium]|nr:hypothetical protein [Actinomycetota bacterium]
MERKRIRRAMTVGMASLVLLAFSLLAASCSKEEGGKEPAPSTGEEIQVEVGKRSDVDSLLRDLDQAMDSVSPEDFSDAQLEDSALGL